MERALPLKFRSRYAMVCYGGEGNLSYANVKALGRVQDEFLDRMCAGLGPVDSEESVAQAVAQVDLNEAERLLDEFVAPTQRKLGIDLSTLSFS